MSARSLLLVRPFAVGFSASALLLLAACSASGPEPEVQASPATASPLVRERLVAPAAAEASHKRLATLAHAPSPIADILPPGYRDESREQYQAYADNPVFAVAETPVSTFSIDVDTGSYANVRRFLNGGQLPPKDAVRLEELVNYFPYAYPLPQGDVPFGVSTELAVTPWNPQTRLLLSLIHI